MATNPDPKPGRWILPLLVLGMVAFTYFFVSELSTGVEEPDTPTTTEPTATTAPDIEPADPTATTAPTAVADPAAQSYLEAVDGIAASVLDLQAEMAAINAGFDADPREVEYAEAVDRLRVLGQNADGVLDEVDALSPPDALAGDHEAIRNAVATVAGAADDALAGLQSTDDGTQRRNAVAAFDQAVSDLQNAIESARATATGEAPPPTEPPEDGEDGDGEGDDGDG